MHTHIRLSESDLVDKLIERITYNPGDPATSNFLQNTVKGPFNKSKRLEGKWLRLTTTTTLNGFVTSRSSNCRRIEKRALRM